MTRKKLSLNRERYLNPVFPLNSAGDRQPCPLLINIPTAAAGSGSLARPPCELIKPRRRASPVYDRKANGRRVRPRTEMRNLEFVKSSQHRVAYGRAFLIANTRAYSRYLRASARAVPRAVNALSRVPREYTYACVRARCIYIQINVLLTQICIYERVQPPVQP